MPLRSGGCFTDDTMKRGIGQCFADRYLQTVPCPDGMCYTVRVDDLPGGMLFFGCGFGLPETKHAVQFHKIVRMV